MLEVVIIILGAFLVFQVCKFNILLGLVVAAILLFYAYFKRYTKLCIAMAMRNYTKGDVGKAFDWFERGYKHGMDINQKMTYAYYLLRSGRTERAEEMILSVLGRNLKKEDRFVAKSHYALLLLKTDRLNEAADELEEIFPYYRNTNIYGSLGYIYILMDDMAKAEEFNKEAYAYNSENAVILDNMVQLYVKLDNYEEAYKYALELMEQKPTFIEAYYDTAFVENKLGKTEDARGHLEHALTIEPTFLSNISHDEVNALMEVLGNPDAAEKPAVLLESHVRVHAEPILATPDVLLDDEDEEAQAAIPEEEPDAEEASGEVETGEQPIYNDDRFEPL